MSKSDVIFGNKVDYLSRKKAQRSKQIYAKKFGDDTGSSFKVSLRDNPVLGDIFNVKDVVLGEAQETSFDKEKSIIVGNIRMGFGHYRMSIAMCSCAAYLGYYPLWMDLNGYPHTTCTKIISEQNRLYSLGSRLSKNPVFNKLVWEPMNYEGFRSINYNSQDQKNAELMAPVFKNIPKDIPVITTHAWPAQAAIHAGMEHVVNAIPDNWPMALHLSEGAVHTIQCKNAYMGYRILNGFKGRKVLRPMPSKDLQYVGHYVDHEIVSNIEKDCEMRDERRYEKKPMRFLLTIGGAGAQKEIFLAIIRYLLPYVEKGKAAIYVNVGDYKNVWDYFLKEVPRVKKYCTEHFNMWDETVSFCKDALRSDFDVEGIHAFYHQDIFEAVYVTNLLMRSCDVLVTKPSELAFYPVPKIFIPRVGKHEMWGAIHSAEIGDGTMECRDIPHVLQMVRMFLKEDFLPQMCDNILENKIMGIYDGAYKAVKIAMKEED